MLQSIAELKEQLSEKSFELEVIYCTHVNLKTLICMQIHVLCLIHTSQMDISEYLKITFHPFKSLRNLVNEVGNKTFRLTLDKLVHRQKIMVNVFNVIS